MKKECDLKQAELDSLLAKTVKDLWNADLDAFETEFDLFEKEIDAADHLSRQQATAKQKGLKGKKVKKLFKKAAVNSDEEEAIEDDSDDDFMPEVKSRAGPPLAKAKPGKIVELKQDDKSAEPVVKSKRVYKKKQPAAPVKATVVDDDDIEMIAPKTKAPPAKPTVFNLTSDSEDSDFAPPSFAQLLAKKNATVKKRAVSDAGDSPESKKICSPSPPKVKKAAVVKKPVSKKPVKKPTVTVDESDASDGDDEFVPAAPISRRVRAAPVKYVEVVSDGQDTVEDNASEASESEVSSDDSADDF